MSVVIATLTACGGGGSDQSAYQQALAIADAKEAEARLLAVDAPCEQVSQCDSVGFTDPRAPCGMWSFKPYSLVSSTAAAAKAGHTSAAAKATVFTDTLEGRLLGQNIKDLKQLEQKLPNALSPNKTWLKDSSLPPVAVARLEELSVSRNARMLDFLKKPDLIERLAPTEVAKAIEEAAHSLRKTFNNVAHNVIDVIENPAEKSIANVHSVTIRFGKPDGTLFETAQKAQSFTKKLVNKSEDYSVVSHPGGFAVEVTKNVDETSGGLRALRLETTEKAPASILSLIHI